MGRGSFLFFIFLLIVFVLHNLGCGGGGYAHGEAHKGSVLAVTS